MIRGRYQTGFTLVELLLASVVTVLVAAATVVILRTTLAIRQRADSQISVQQNSTRAMHVISSALRNVFRPPPGVQKLLEGTDDWQGDMPADRIRFFAISPDVIREGTPESDVKEYEFFLRAPEGQKNSALMLRLDPTRNESPDYGGVLMCIAENVVGFDVSYFDGELWCDDWDEDKQQWPRAFRIRLVVVDPKTQKKFRHTQRIVTNPRLVSQSRQRSREADTR